jgi:hypothetical protein
MVYDDPRPVVCMCMCMGGDRGWSNGDPEREKWTGSYSPVTLLCINSPTKLPGKEVPSGLNSAVS